MINEKIRVFQVCAGVFTDDNGNSKEFFRAFCGRVKDGALVSFFVEKINADVYKLLAEGGVPIATTDDKPGEAFSIDICPHYDRYGRLADFTV